MSEMQAVFRQPFLEQVAFFRQKLGNLVPTARWDDLWKSQHDHGFMVAGAVKANLLADFAQAVTACVAQGKSLEWFRANFDSIVEKHGWAYKGPRDWRTRVIYQTNMLTSYAAGRLAQLREFPLWIYRHSDLVVHPRLHHVVLDGLMLPSDHPFWRTHYPPNGWGCCCYVLGARDMEDARLLGGDPDKRLPEGWDVIDPRTGEPAGIDKGWGYMPGGTVVDTVQALGAKLPNLPIGLGVALGEILSGFVSAAWDGWVDAVLAGLRHDPGLLGVLTRVDVDLLQKAGHMPTSAEVRLRPGLLKGPKAERHALAGNALTPEQWKRLPALFKGKHRQVFFDAVNDKVLFVMSDGSGDVQMAVRVNFREKKPKREGNLAVSVYLVTAENIQNRIKRGDLVELKAE